MARRAAVRKSGGVVVVSAPAPARRRSYGRRTYRRARRAGKRIARSYAGASLKTRMQGGFMGGFAVGIIEKTFGSKIPTLPYVGRKGAIALAVYFGQPKTKLLQDVGLAAACLAGYEFGKDGVISGQDGDDYDDDSFFATT